MKYCKYKCYLLILTLCSSVLGCDEPAEEDLHNVLKIDCEKSGGAFDGDALKCQCGETLCESGIVCDGTDKTKCAGAPVVDPLPIDPVDPNNAACEASGGIYDVAAKQCHCGANVCGIGDVCDDNDKTICADFDCLPKTSICLNGTYQVCSDQGRWSTIQACPNDVSCKSATECGECKDGDTRCEDDAETNAGTLKVCAQGKWEVQNACADEKGNPASCLKEDGAVYKACGECINNPVQQCINMTEKGTDSDYQIGYLYICEGGKMRGFTQTDAGIQYTEEKYVKCDSGNSCNPERTGCGECSVGRNICRNDGMKMKDGHPDGHIGQIYTCEDGKLSQDPVPCDNETLCDKRSSGQACGVCGMTSLWHGGRQCITDSNGQQHSQICAEPKGDGVWDYLGYWQIWTTCNNKCISDTTYGENCYGRCLNSNNQCY